MPLVNLTPHPVTVFDGGDRVAARYPAAASPARLAVTRTEAGTVEGVPVVAERYGSADLPAPAEGVSYIVSVAVALAHPDRLDLLVPTDLVRTEDGTVIGCRALGRRSGPALSAPSENHRSGNEK